MMLDPSVCVDHMLPRIGSAGTALSAMIRPLCSLRISVKGGCGAGSMMGWDGLSRAYIRHCGITVNVAGGSQ
jgi:hypothetical protein